MFGYLEKKEKFLKAIESNKSCYIFLGGFLGGYSGWELKRIYMITGRLSRFADEIAREEKGQVFAIRIDCSDSRSVREAFEGVLSLGFVEVLVYNAHQPVSWNPTNFADIRIEAFEKSLAVSSVGAFHCAQQVPYRSSTPFSVNTNNVELRHEILISFAIILYLPANLLCF